MAFGFTPKYSQDLHLEDLSREQSLVIAALSIEKCKWKIITVSYNGITAYTDKGIFSRNSEIKIAFQDGIATITSTTTGSEMFDMGSNKKNTDEFIKAFTSTRTTHTSEEIVVRYEELSKTFVPEDEDSLAQSSGSARENALGFLSFFIPRNGYFITPILIDINILIFIIMAVTGVSILMPDSESLLKWGANFRPATLEGQWWRLISNCFLHIGILHLLMNMYALLYIGLLLEPHLGKTGILTAYFLTGLVASTTSLLWHPLTISAGASGAIFGLYGVFLAMLTTNLIEKNARNALLASIAIFVGYNLLYGLKGGIDNAAHLGGLIAGIGFGYAYVPGLKEPEIPELRYKAIMYLTVIAIAFTIVSYKNLPNDFSKYDLSMKKFAETEVRAMEIYKLPENTPRGTILYEIKNRAIYYWNENIKLVKGLDKLKLPEPIMETNKRLLQYCELRIKSLELTYKAIEEESPLYKQQIDECNAEIESILNTLNNKK